VTALSVIPRHDVPRNPSTSFGMPYRRDPLKRDVAPTMNDPVNVIMTQSDSEGSPQETPSRTKWQAGGLSSRVKRGISWKGCLADARHDSAGDFSNIPRFFDVVKSGCSHFAVNLFTTS